jgi:phage tail tape-measure protein
MGSGAMIGTVAGGVIGSFFGPAGSYAGMGIGASLGGAAGNMYDTKQAQSKADSQMKALQNQPVPVTTPMPTAADPNPAETLAQKQKKLQAMQYGFASTITNKPAFDAPLSTPSAQPLKSKFGQ